MSKLIEGLEYLLRKGFKFSQVGDLVVVTARSQEDIVFGTYEGIGAAVSEIYDNLNMTIPDVGEHRCDSYSDFIEREWLEDY
jgi:hypothetical protein